MSYLIGSGVWIVWYALLWLALSPFVYMTVLFTRALPNESSEPLETMFGVSSLGLFVLVCASTISAYLWTAATSPGGVWPYVRNVVGALLVALLVGTVFIFGAGYYAVTPKLPMFNRWAAQLTCVGSAALLVAFCLHATWKFRHR